MEVCPAGGAVAGVLWWGALWSTPTLAVEAEEGSEGNTDAEEEEEKEGAWSL